MGIGIFWGILLITIGLSIIFKVFFGISIIRIVLAVLFILIGLKLLFGRSMFHIKTDENSVVFNERYFNEFPVGNTEYSTVFGKSVYDFRDAAIPTDKALVIKFNTIFGNSEIKLPPGLPVKIKGEAVFGATRLPNNNTAVFGGANYVSDQDSSYATFVTIEAVAVFGNIDIYQ